MSLSNKSIPNTKISSNFIKNPSSPFMDFNSFKGKHKTNAEFHIKSLQKPSSLGISKEKPDPLHVPKIMLSKAECPLEALSPTEAPINSK